MNPLPSENETAGYMTLFQAGVWETAGAVLIDSMADPFGFAPEDRPEAPVEQHCEGPCAAENTGEGNSSGTSAPITEKPPAGYPFYERMRMKPESSPRHPLAGSWMIEYLSRPASALTG